MRNRLIWIKQSESYQREKLLVGYQYSLKAILD